MATARIRRGRASIRRWAAAVLVLVVWTGTVACAGPQSTIHLPMTAAEFFGEDLVIEDHGSFGEDRTSVIDSGDERFRAALRVYYPEGSASPEVNRESGNPEGGAQYYLRWSAGPVDEAYLRYFVRLPDGFDFVRGGKLPGLFSGTATGGGNIPDGTNGFSTRYMWRARGIGEVYAYLPTSEVHGTSLGQGAWSWPTGDWTEVQQHVRLNTPGRDDGQIRVWLNGEQVLDEQHLIFRTTEELQIEGLLFSTFFGGGDPSWATPRDQHADFAGFTLSDSYVTAIG